MENLIHELWLIYTEWGENGDDPYKLPELRERLGKVINALNATNPAAIIGRQGGQKGGSAKTEAKREAARANGAKGGRPLGCCICKQKAVQIMDFEGDRFAFCATHVPPEDQRLSFGFDVRAYFAKTKVKHLESAD